MQKSVEMIILVFKWQIAGTVIINKVTVEKYLYNQLNKTKVYAKKVSKNDNMHPHNILSVKHLHNHAYK